MADQHPAPWKWGWSSDGRMVVLFAADHSTVLRPGDGNSLVPASPRVMDLISAAPEMEALLRHGDELESHCGNSDRDNCWTSINPPCRYHRTRALLARIDEAGR